VALDTSLEHPAPVRVIANAMTGYIDRLGVIWVEGQIAQLTRRPSTATVFMTLRDPLAEVSVQVTCHRSVLDAMPTPVTEGARVVVQAKFSYYVPRGSLSLQAREIRPVGVGELLARIEQRRQLLAAEGLFDPARKRRLPFLPRRIGLVVGRDSAAERDVVDNARRRWPGVSFRIEHAVVQGHDAARQVIDALRVLDKDADVDVIIVSRGGGALEDLLPFSDEGLVRAVARCRTPVVSAIGHEPDQPLLDLVADVRASTPTDAAKLVVPDVAEELRIVAVGRDRLRSAVAAFLDRESALLATLRSRPALADPGSLLTSRADEVEALRERALRTTRHRLDRATDEITHQRARARALSPLATLQRGYAVLQDADGHVLTSVAGAATGAAVAVRVADGRVHAKVTSTEEIDA
jgi:exodeoxyribonuclease VII large subunit